MDLRVFSAGELRVVLGSLRGVALASEGFTDAERDFVRAVAHIHEAELDVDALEPATPADVARVVTDPHHRKSAVELAIVLTLVEGDPDQEAELTVRALANDLGITEPAVRSMQHLAQGHSLLARFEMARRMRSGVASVRGFPGFLRAALPFLGIGAHNPEVSMRYRALSACPPSSFGFALHRHFRNNGFAFPGERYGLPESMVFHDVGHVLSGYGVDPEGEIQQAAFQAGFRRADGFLFLLFGVLQFHLGLRLSPSARGQRGMFDVKRVLRAAERGSACKVDLGSGFDPFAYADMPLDVMRARLGIPAN